MKVYTKSGDQGMARLMNPNLISKSDDRFQALGTIDELSSNIGLVKCMCPDRTKQKLDRIQKTLQLMMSGIADPRNRDYVIAEEEITFLETEIDEMENSFPRKKEFILPGGCEKSARLDVARTVARRAERCVTEMAKKYGVDVHTRRYLNRLSDYLYISARLSDYEKEQENAGFEEGEKSLVEQVLEKINEYCALPLDRVTPFMQKIESYAKQKGRKAVIAVCNAQGNPVAVHVMDDAFLVSFQVAVQKAYTAVAVKMSTMELSRLVQPGQTFFGLDSLQDGKIVAFGGGVPLKMGDKIVGGLGISGGTGEEDHELCEYGLSIFPEFFGNGGNAR